MVTSDRERPLGIVFGAGHAHVEVVRGLLRRHAVDDRAMEGLVVALVFAPVPDAQEDAREQAVEGAVGRELVVLAPGDEAHRGLDAVALLSPLAAAAAATALPRGLDLEAVV